LGEDAGDEAVRPHPSPVHRTNARRPIPRQTAPRDESAPRRNLRGIRKSPRASRIFHRKPGRRDSLSRENSRPVIRESRRHRRTCAEMFCWPMCRRSSGRSTSSWAKWIDEDWKPRAAEPTKPSSPKKRPRANLSACSTEDTQQFVRHRIIFSCVDFAEPHRPPCEILFKNPR
jgi:hypothetical protein